MKRTTTSTIFRTVVFAGAMLGAPACKKNNAQTTPSNATPSTTDPATTGDDKPAADPTTSADPCAGAEADPCSGDGRPRGTDEDGGGGEGRGFILS